MNSTAMKTVLKVAACVIALFIPSYIAIASFVMAQNAPVSEKSVSRLEITDVAGSYYSLDAAKEEDAAVIADFVAINDRAKKQSSLPEPLVGTDYFEFKYHNYGRISTYRYYFSTNPNEAYFVDHNGDAYQIAEADAASFLSTTWARCLYNTTSFPTMTISGETVVPAEAEWAYQTYGGEYVPLEDIPSGGATEKVYPMKGAFAMSFDDQPDFLTLTISDNGTIIYSDVYENIANAQLEGKTIEVVAEASWYESEEQTCYGTATYRFKAKILLPAVFYLGETTIDPGEFVVISAKNVDDPSAITFTSDPDIGYTPTFFADGDYVRALVPIRYDFTGTGVKFTCSYGEVTQEMNLDIAPKTFKSVGLDIRYDIVSQTRTEATLAAFAEAARTITATAEPTRMWEGAFLEGMKGGTLNCGFGVYRTIRATGETYRHEGVDYVFGKGGSDVFAVNHGKVAYVGYLDLTGYLIVIDHGLGLKSWYAHLGSTMVNVGDTVEKGQVIGLVGSTGFTKQPALHMGMSVYDVPICPYDLWEDEKVPGSGGVIMTE